MVYTIFILPLLIIIIGFLMFKHPPKKINWFIGYRTRKSMKNEKMWKFANEYCGKLLISIGIIMFVISILLFCLLQFELLNLTDALISIVMFFQVVIIVLSIFAVENKIEHCK